MSIETFKAILGETTLSDEQLEILLERAKRMALNHYYWKIDDEPTIDEKENFINRYEFEIYDYAKAVVESASREGLIEFSELGVTRRWESSGDKSVEDALDKIPVNTYVW